MTQSEHPDRKRRLRILESRTAAVLQGLPDRVRLSLGASDEILIVLDGLVMAAKTLLDDEDSRHWTEKLGTVFESFADVGETYGPQIAEYVMNLDEDRLTALFKKYAQHGYLEYVNKMIGEAAFHRLRVAISEDSDTIAAAAYRAVDAAMPYAQALEDLADLVPETTIREFMDFHPAGGFMLELTMTLFDVLDTAVTKVVLPEIQLEALDRVRLESVATRDDMGDPKDLLDLTSKLRQRISGQSRELLLDVSAVLDRKLRGAKDALAYSADSVSQAANSLVEFIDRLLRAAFSEEEVLTWLDSNYTELGGLTYEDKNQNARRPSKRGQALCMIHAARAVSEPSPIHVLAATSLNATRRKLQQLKHADRGTVEEQEQIEKCLLAVEAFVQLGCRVAWAQLPDEALDELKVRLGSPSTADRPMTDVEEASA